METRDTDKYESGYISEYLERVRSPQRIMEVGVKNGGSLLLWCDLWPRVQKVIGVDLNPALRDLHPKISVVQIDQTDGPSLDRLGSAEGPFDLIIDDASHLGEASWMTFRALWPHVAPGGLYVVEDWTVGYLNSWPDGAEYRDLPPPGHTAGMVGMVKRLVDELEAGNMKRLDLLYGLAFAHKAP